MNKKFLFSILGVAFFLVVFFHALLATNFTEPVPLPELGTNTYLNQQGGLYPGGSNTPPTSYFNNQIQPAYNTLNNDNHIVMLCLGMSNMRHACNSFISQVEGNPNVNPAIKIVNGARSGRAQQAWDDTPNLNDNNDAWSSANKKLSDANETPQSVNVVLYFNAWGFPDEPDFVTYAQTMQNSLGTTMSSIASLYPNTQLIYVTSREYAGYVVTDLNPDPWAYWDGFAFKWLVADRINGVTSGPPLLWQAYQYDPTWPQSYFRAGDGVHLSDEGLAVVGPLWFDFFMTQPWFATTTDPGPTPTHTATATPTATATATATPTATATATPTAVPKLQPRAFIPLIINP